MMIGVSAPGTTGIGSSGTVAPPEPAPIPVESVPPVIPLNVPGDAEPCTSCGREALMMAIAERSDLQRAADEQVLAQVAAAYAASRP